LSQKTSGTNKCRRKIFFLQYLLLYYFRTFIWNFKRRRKLLCTNISDHTQSFMKHTHREDNWPVNLSQGYECVDSGRWEQEHFHYVFWLEIKIKCKTTMTAAIGIQGSFFHLSISYQNFSQIILQTDVRRCKQETTWLVLNMRQANVQGR
jgi:hypothetical protein